MKVLIIQIQLTWLLVITGPVVRLKGGILRMAQLDASGTLLPHGYESWYEPNAPEEEREQPRRRRPTSPPSSQENPDCQYAVVCLRETG